MIIKGDKIKLVQKIGNFDKVGDIFEVTGVDNGVVSFRCNYGTGCMSYGEFEKYFEKIEKKAWSKWTIQAESFDSPITNKHCVMNLRVRDNGKKIQVRSCGYKAEATCCSCDKFDFDKGYELAKKRLIVKILRGQIDTYAKSL